MVSRTTCSISQRRVASRAEKGSSSSSSVGREARIRARATRCCCPRRAGRDSGPPALPGAAAGCTPRRRPALGAGQAPLPFQAGHDVLGHCHIGKQGVVLEQIAHPAALGPPVDPAGRVKDRLPRRSGSPPRWGAALPRCSAASCSCRSPNPQQGQGLPPGLKGHIQLKLPPPCGGCPHRLT